MPKEPEVKKQLAMVNLGDDIYSMTCGISDDSVSVGREWVTLYAIRL